MNIHSLGDDFIAAVQQYRDKQWQGGPIVDGKTVETDHWQASLARKRLQNKRGIYWGDKKLAEQALQSANKAYRAWREVPVDERATARKICRLNGS